MADKVQIQNEICGDIPLARAMDFEIVEVGENFAKTKLPLAANKNHLGTLFGGSLYSACALTSYSALLSILSDNKIEDFDLVIVDGRIQYLKPGRGTAEVLAQCSLEEKQDFLNKLKLHSRARLVFKAEVFEGSKLLARFEGLYQVNLKQN